MHLIILSNNVLNVNEFFVINIILKMIIKITRLINLILKSMIIISRIYYIIDFLFEQKNLKLFS